MKTKKHNLKLLKVFADDVLNGNKTFEVRYNDRGFQKGDLIEFSVIEKGVVNDYNVDHALNGKRFEITYVLNGWGLKENYVVLAIKPCD